jgi:hypothetical protein
MGIMGQRSKLELALALAAALSAAMPLATAEAQGFYAERADMEGPGFKVGRLVLHPGLALTGGYDSNVFLQASDEQPAFILRLSGYLDVATEGAVRQSEGEANAPKPQKVEFRAGLGAHYYHFFDQRIPGAVGGDAHVDFAYNPSKVFSLVVWNNFIRTVRPFSNPNTDSGETMSYGRNLNRATLELVGRSKSEVLEGRIGYTSSIEAFDADVYAYGKNLTHSVPASLTWKFFPTSALVYDIVYAHQQYRNPDAVSASPTLLSDNNRVSNLIGYNGAVTERLSLTAMIGYAAGFFTIGDSFDDVIARVEARWQVRPNIVLTSGYNRILRPSFIGNYYLANRLHLNTHFIIHGAFQFGTNAWVSFDTSGLALNPDGSLLGNQPYREDIRVNVTLFGEYRFRSWLALFGDFGFLADFTDFQYSGTGALLAPVARYQRFEGWLGVRVFY